MIIHHPSAQEHARHMKMSKKSKSPSLQDQIFGQYKSLFISFSKRSCLTVLHLIFSAFLCKAFSITPDDIQPDRLQTSEKPQKQEKKIGLHDFGANALPPLQVDFYSSGKAPQSMPVILTVMIRGAAIEQGSPRQQRSVFIAFSVSPSFILPLTSLVCLVAEPGNSISRSIISTASDAISCRFRSQHVRALSECPL